MKKPLYKILFLLSLFLANSCNLDNFDFDKLSKEVDLSPEFTLPIAQADISVWDIIEAVNSKDDTLIQNGGNNVVQLVYRKENIYTYPVTKMLNLKKREELNSGSKKIGSISAINIVKSFNITIRQLQEKLSGSIDNLVAGVGVFPDYDFVGPPGADYSVGVINNFTSISFETGDLEIKLTNKLRTANIIVGGDFVDLNSTNTINQVNFTSIAPNQSQTRTISLNGKSISNNVGFKMLKFQSISNGFPDNINLDDQAFTIELTFKNLKVSAGNVKIDAQTISGFSGSLDVDFGDGVKIFEAGFTYGTLNFSTTNSSGLTGRINLTFPGIEDNRGVAMTVSVPFNGNNNTKTLAGAKVNLALDPLQLYNKVKYEYSIELFGSSGYTSFTSNDAVSLGVVLDNLQFKYVKGDFGNKVESIPPGAFEMDSEIWDRITGSFKLADPNFDLVFTNSIGVPALINASFVAQNKSGQTVTLSRDPFPLEKPLSINGPAIKQTVSYNSTNSNIVDFIALPPSGNITYSGNVRFNPNGGVTLQDPNFFNITDSLRIDVDVKLPLKLQISNLSFADTVKLEGKDFDKIKTAQMIIKAVNGIPLDIDLQLFFIDTISGHQYSSSLKSKILSAAQITDAGAITATQATNSISLDENTITGMRQANGMVIKGFLSSPNNGTKTAVIYSTSRLGINVVLKSKIDL